MIFLCGYYIIFNYELLTSDQAELLHRFEIYYKGTLESLKKE